MSATLAGDQTAGPSRRGLTVTQAVADLNNALANKETSPEQLKELVATVRAAKVRAKKELAESQKELMLVITEDQEAVLTAMGYID